MSTECLLCVTGTKTIWFSVVIQLLCNSQESSTQTRKEGIIRMCDFKVYQLKNFREQQTGHQLKSKPVKTWTLPSSAKWSGIRCAWHQLSKSAKDQSSEGTGLAEWRAGCSSPTATCRHGGDFAVVLGTTHASVDTGFVLSSWNATIYPNL